MGSVAQLELLREVAIGLESGEDSPLTPLVRKASRLAASLELGQHSDLFSAHLEGISRPAVQQAFIKDRLLPDGTVQAQSLPMLEQQWSQAAQARRATASGMGTKELELAQILQRIRNRLGAFAIEAEALLLAENTAGGPAAAGRRGDANEARTRDGGTKVFFGHGRSEVWREVRDYVRDRLDLPWDEFNREATAGITAPERLEEMLNDARFAVLVMTGEDERADGATTARANVIHEVGLFQGRLGFRRAIVLLEDGCEAFTNILGLMQIRFPKHEIRVTFDELRRVLEREGIVSK